MTLKSFSKWVRKKSRIQFSFVYERHIHRNITLMKMCRQQFTSRTNKKGREMLTWDEVEFKTTIFREADISCVCVCVCAFVRERERWEGADYNGPDKNVMKNQTPLHWNVPSNNYEQCKEIKHTQLWWEKFIILAQNISEQCRSFRETTKA